MRVKARRTRDSERRGHGSLRNRIPLEKTVQSHCGHLKSKLRRSSAAEAVLTPDVMSGSHLAGRQYPSPFLA